MTTQNLPLQSGELSALVEIDLPCATCYHNLKDKPLDGVCPKCGTAIEVSTHRDLLKLSDPKWVDGLRMGISFILSSFVVMTMGFIAVVTAALVTHQKTDPTEALLPVLAFVLIYVLGWWLLTVPDPSGLGENHYGTSRKLVRSALLVGVASQGFTFMTRSAELPKNVQMVVAMVNVAVGVLAFIGFLAKFRYLSKLALRIPDGKLADRATFLTWAMGISMGLYMMVLIRAGFIFSNGRPMPRGLMIDTGAAGLVLGLALFMFVIAYLKLLANMGQAFKYQAEWARQKAEQATMPGNRIVP